MKTAIATLESISPYSQSKVITEKKKTGESHEDHEERTWRQRLHVTPEGFVFMPPMAFKGAISEAAKYLGIQIPGKGKATYTKNFEAGILCTDGLVLPIKAKDVEPERLFVPASGKRGDGSRVWKTFPKIEFWEGDVTFHIIDETVLQTFGDSGVTVFEHVLSQAGAFIGVGRFRPRNNGFYGRFKVAEVKIS
jgi:hypothetical protein